MKYKFVLGKPYFNLVKTKELFESFLNLKQIHKFLYTFSTNSKERKYDNKTYYFSGLKDL